MWSYEYLYGKMLPRTIPLSKPFLCNHMLKTLIVISSPCIRDHRYPLPNVDRVAALRQTDLAVDYRNLPFRHRWSHFSWRVTLYYRHLNVSSIEASSK